MKLRSCPTLRLIILLPILYSQPARPHSSPALPAAPALPASPSDTARAASLHSRSADSLARPLTTIPLLGSLDRSIPASQVIDDSARHFMNYEILSDLLRQTPGIFTISHGSPGQFAELTLNGLGARDIAILSDGIVLNEPYTGTYNLNLYPLEEIERTEVVPGTRSFLYGLNGAAGAINLVTRSRRAVHPWSHIRYSDDGYGYSLLDGMISEDIIRGLNVTAGARHTTTGGRFPNSDYDAWSGRVSARYDLSSGVNLFGSEVYNQTRLDMNGGIDSTTPVDERFERLLATVRNTDSYEKISRHDIRFGLAANLKADSNAVHMLTFYYSNNLREYRDEENRPDPNGIFLQQDQQSSRYGLKADEHRTIENVVLDIGAEVQSQTSSAGPPSAGGSAAAANEMTATQFDIFAKSDVRLTGGVRVSAYARHDRADGQNCLSMGADGTVEISDRLEMFGGTSRFYRFPTIQELEGTPGVVSPLLSSDAEQHRLVEAGIRSLPGGGTGLELRAFHRSIDGQIGVVPQDIQGIAIPFAFTRTGNTILRGLDAAAALRLGSFFLEGTAQYTGHPGQPDGVGDVPSWTGTGGAYFWDTLFAGHLNLKAGFQGNFFSSYQGREYNEQALIDVPPGTSSTVDPSGTVDFLLIAHLGDAYLHFIWENLLDRRYIMRVFYPMPDRNLRFGVSWDFLN